MDTIFDTYIRELRLNYKEEYEGKWETFDFSQHSLLQEYALGTRMFCSWSFKDTDILLIPMFMREAKHWVLGHVECRYMTLSI